MKNYMETTCEYYSKWLGQEGILNQDFNGVRYLYSDQRNVAQYGYESPFDIYALCQKNRAVISYGDAAADRLNTMKDAIGNAVSAEEITQVLERIFQCSVSRSIKYVFEAIPVVSPKAKVLTEDDYEKYETFFLKCNPGQEIDWLREYFDEMAQEHMCVGVFENDVLVSCTDAPGMPYMAGEVQEIGINTLLEYRGRGYASAACSRCIQEIFSNRKVPLWSTEMGNVASRRLAERIGFVEFAEVIHLCEREFHGSRS